MSNIIQPYGYAQAYDRLPQRSDAQQPKPQTSVAAQAAPQTAEAQTSEPSGTATPPSGAGGLEPAEQEMINHYFPTSRAMSMRLYGPNGQSHTVNPGALGTRMDLQG